MQGECGNEATWRVQANPISCFVFVWKGIHHSEFLFVFSSGKGKRNKDCMICISLYASSNKVKRNPYF